MEWGIGRKWLKFNAAKYVEDKPSPPKKKMPKATVEEVRLLIETAPQVHPDLAAYFLTAALTGLRRQALTGLMWGDFDWDKQTVTINRVHNSVWGKVQTVAWAKHRKGKPVPVHLLDPVVVDTLHALHNAQLERCKQTGTTPPSAGWVFSYDGMGLTPMEPDYVQRQVKAIGDLAGLPYRSHDMRHHRGTELIAAGVDVARVAAELDHEDISLTLRTYVGATPAGDTVITALGRQYVNTERLASTPAKRATAPKKAVPATGPVPFRSPRRSRRSTS
jgi:integrase